MPSQSDILPSTEETDCVIEETLYCERCNEEIEGESYTVEVSDTDAEEWCERCVEYHTLYSPNGRRMSESYWESHYFICERCDGTFPQDEYAGEGLCDDCASEEQEEDEDQLLAPYSTRAEHVHGFFGAPMNTWHPAYGHTHYKTYGNTLYFGIELEIECQGDYGDFTSAVTRIKELLSGFAIVKSDGSLSEKGFELVTSPATLPEFKRHTRRFFEAFPGLCHEYQLRSWHTPTCGLHIHVSRNALSELQIGKIQALVTDPNSYPMVRKVAGRNSKRWSGYSDKKQVKDRPGIMGHSPERYTAINLCNRNTVEFRLFKGTTLEAGIFRNIEFVLAIVDFTAPGGGQSLVSVHGPNDFQAWLAEPAQRKTYPHLTRFLVQRGFVVGHSYHGNTLRTVN